MSEALKALKEHVEFELTSAEAKVVKFADVAKTDVDNEVRRLNSAAQHALELYHDILRQLRTTL